MKAITYGLCFLFVVSFGSSKAQGLQAGALRTLNKTSWEVGLMSLVPTQRSGIFYSTVVNTPAGPMRTELHRDGGFMHRSYVRSNTSLNQNWMLYFMGDVALQLYRYSSREYYSDGSFRRANYYASGDPSGSTQMGLSMGTIYQRPVSDLLKIRAGGGLGVILGFPEEPMPWLSEGLATIGIAASLRMTAMLEAGIDYQLSKVPNRAHLLVSYALHHAFANDESIVNHLLPTHHGLQMGFRFGFYTKKPAERRSDVMGF